MDVCRRRPLDGRPLLVDLLIQRQRQRSVSHRQPQHQRLLGDRHGVVTRPAHVLLGVVEALDRLASGKVEKILAFLLEVFQCPTVGLLPFDALKQLVGGFQHMKRMQELQKASGDTAPPPSPSPDTLRLLFLHITA